MLIAVTGLVATTYQEKFGWMTFIVLVTNGASQNVVMADGENTTADMVTMWEWFANTRQYQHQVTCRNTEFAPSVEEEVKNHPC